MGIRNLMTIVKKHCPEEIWNNSKYNKLRESINSKKYISICNNCNVVRPSIYLIPNTK